MAERIMTERVAMMEKKVHIKKYPLCIEKAKIWLEAYKQVTGQPEIYRRTHVLSELLDKCTIFIEDGELIVGNTASKPMGIEVTFWSGLWPQSEIAALRDETDGSGFIVDPGVEEEMEKQNEYWKSGNYTLRCESLMNEEQTMPFLERGVILPPWKRGIGWTGRAESGLGIGPYNIVCIDWEGLLARGMYDYIREAKEELSKTIVSNEGDAKKVDFLKCAIKTLEAIINISNRFSKLATEMAEKETDAQRKKELLQIAENCATVPAYPAKTFWQALQCVWLVFDIMGPSPVTPFGRMDQYLYPYFKADKEAGRITDEEAIELLECFRVKDMQLNRTSGKDQREKWAGMAKWHNCVIGGTDKEGNDATNELSYLILEAAYRCRTPHHTITVRVNENTPDKLMEKAIELVSTGVGLPAFIGDKSYIANMVKYRGVPAAEANNYAVGGCIDAILPAKSRVLANPMTVAPLAIEYALYNGEDLMQHKPIGLKLGDASTIQSFEELLENIHKQIEHILKLGGEHNNVQLLVRNEMYPEVLAAIFMEDGLKVGRCLYDRTYTLENALGLNAVGVVNMGDSLAAIKKLVYDDKVCTLKQLADAMACNWEGEENEKLRQLCLKAPKYGNNDPYVDQYVAKVYEWWFEGCEKVPNAIRGSHTANALSITAHWPGGKQIGASADGRKAGEPLADAGSSAMRGADKNGPLSLLQSVLSLPNEKMQGMLLNMKILPSSLKTESDMAKLGSVVKTFLNAGGKHIQFNVADRATLQAAQDHPDEHQNLIVRVAGYSTYFVALGRVMQNELIDRTEHVL